jgi:hypothetical protein
MTCRPFIIAQSLDIETPKIKLIARLEPAMNSRTSIAELTSLPYSLEPLIEESLGGSICKGMLCCKYRS